MSVNKRKDGQWLANVNKQGLKRVRKLFATKAEAEQFERDYIVANSKPVPAAAAAPIIAEPVAMVVADVRTMTDLVALWFMYHGVNLSDGDRRQRCLASISKELGNPLASSLTAEQFVAFRFKKLQGGMMVKTFNNQHGYLSAMYERLKKLKVIDYHNPIESVDFIKTHERQLSYLSVDQISTLMDAITNGCKNESTYWVAQICARTGARWGEVEKLTKKQLHDGRITFEFTKSKRTRTVPLCPSFYVELLSFVGFKNPNDRLFTNCIGSFRRAAARSGIDFPQGQCSHILRHTFASHFMINGGNILSLQNILGHADITMTMHYAHLAPDHSIDAIKLNPIALGAANG
ncbi:phage integrase [Methylovulum psychrotolerans]|uniref:Tyrosine recombinase XerC n=1 Tax=Methylovulum psychrotolerans TaxID=1704499 RepID=A0A2S5CGE0_9GAMM|nr:tyrosine-type recombinase/integrase [Methylovulum psychrotolerans]POZ49866.1 tyrosine recombinase XerC [Methylovulum psychrotolerans]